MKPKPPKPIWCEVDTFGHVQSSWGTHRGATEWVALDESDNRIIRYIPIPTKRRKPRRKGYRAGGMS